MLSKGVEAPDFELNSSPDQRLRLSDLRGKRVVLAFYPADWSPVCGDQMVLYNEARRFFQELNAEILGISVDSTWSHHAFAQDRGLHFPLLADFEPKGYVSRRYGAYNMETGQSRRALFVIDEDGIIQWSEISPDSINPGIDRLLITLEKLKPSKGYEQAIASRK
jgi:peroxiredoxin